jgi:hypothetical protein
MEFHTELTMSTFTIAQTSSPANRALLMLYSIYIMHMYNPKNKIQFSPWLCILSLCTDDPMTEQYSNNYSLLLGTVNMLQPCCANTMLDTAYCLRHA